jgi:hypothetical protein
VHSVDRTRVHRMEVAAPVRACVRACVLACVRACAGWMWPYCALKSSPAFVISRSGEMITWHRSGHAVPCCIIGQHVATRRHTGMHHGQPRHQQKVRQRARTRSVSCWNISNAIVLLSSERLMLSITRRIVNGRVISSS